MKKHNWKKGCAGILLLSVLMSQSVVLAKEDIQGTKKGDLYIREMTFSTDSKEVANSSGKFEGSIMVDDERYVLDTVEQTVVDKTPVKVETPVEKTIDSEPMDSEYQPEETIEENGITYTLDRVEEKEQQEAANQQVSGYTDYDHAVSKSDVPATKKVTVKDNQTGENRTVTCSLANVEALTKSGWEDTHIDITFESYDSNVFKWNGVTVAKNDSAPLSGYESQLLQSVGANTSDYKVLRTYWTGEPYTDNNGILCRNARADVQRKVQYYRANYKGVIEHPAKTVYTAYYKGVDVVESEDDFNYTVKLTATYKLDTSILSTQEIAAIMGVALLLLGGIWLLFILRKKKREKESE